MSEKSESWYRVTRGDYETRVWCHICATFFIHFRSSRVQADMWREVTAHQLKHSERIPWGQVATWRGNKDNLGHAVTRVLEFNGRLSRITACGRILQPKSKTDDSPVTCLLCLSQP